MYQSTHTGAQVDEAVDKALTADAVPTPGSTNLVQSGGVASAVSAVGNAVSRRNLLDNAYFVGGGSQQGGGQFPINQRGLTSYTGDVYTIDRWRTRTGMVIGVAADGLTFTKSGANYVDFYQPLEQTLLDYLAGKTVTVSALTNKGLFEFGSFTWDSSGSGSGKGGTNNTIRLYAGGTTPFFTNFLLRVYDTSYVLYAVKLELGSVSTLANDVPPCFAEELAKCQYYFRRIANNKSNAQWCMTGMNESAQVGIFVLDNQMRAVDKSVTYSGTLSVNGQTVTSITSITRNHDTTLNCVTSGGLTAYGGAGLIISAGGYLDISADL